MKIFLLKRVDMTFGSYDEYYGFVIRAETEEAAREIAVKESRDRDSGSWKDPSWSTCEELTSEGPEGILIEDFHAG